MLIFVALGCGGAETIKTTPDESTDLLVGNMPEESSAAHLQGTRAAGRELDGTQWKWVEAHCTEGPLDLASRGFQSMAYLTSDDQGFLITYDRLFGQTCEETVMQRATPGSDKDSAWQMSEVAHVVNPSMTCPQMAEEDRPGDVRLRGDFLEVYVQRSVWCGGFEVKMVYAPMPKTPLTNAQIARHYVGQFNRRDAVRVARLFAETGSLVEPFNLTETGGPSRHEGRNSVYGWYAESMSAVPWLGLKLVKLTPGSEAEPLVIDWHYMDPRLDAPFAGRNRFTIAGGEIFESHIEITAQEVPPESVKAFAEQAAAAPKAEAEDAAPPAEPAAEKAPTAENVETKKAEEPVPPKK